MGITYDLIIIGAGPAGLFCAIQCAAGGARVLVLERNASPGRKLLIAGSTRCNLTSAGDIAGFPGRYGDAGRFVKPALYHFTNRDLAEYFERGGLPLAEMNGGKMFPASQKSRDVLDFLLRDAERFGSEIRSGEKVLALKKSGNFFMVRTVTEEYRSRRVLISTGGRSYPATGSTGDGYLFAEALGHTIEPTVPALTPLYVKDFFFGECAGISLNKTRLTLYRNGKKSRHGEGDVLFTHRGLSGPGVLDISRYVLPGDTVKVRLVEGMSPEELESRLDSAAETEGAVTLKKFLARLPVPERLALAVAGFSGADAAARLSELDRKRRRALGENFTALPFVVERPGDYSEAMATRGGVSRREVNGKTLESKLVPGLYFAGEVLDVDGDTGGFNLQFAFSSGKLAADSIISVIKTEVQNEDVS